MAAESDCEYAEGVSLGGRKRVTTSTSVTTLILIAFVVISSTCFISQVASAASSYPMIGTSVSLMTIGGENYTAWTVTSIGGSGNILRSDVYVQVRNATGLVIVTTPLSTTSGTHGFLYKPSTSGSYIATGDVFALSTDYTTGCSLTLVSGSGAILYCVLAVPATIPPPSPSENPLWIIATVVIAAIAVISVAVIVQRRRRSRKKQ